jgi:hypothetical protein
VKENGKSWDISRTTRNPDVQRISRIEELIGFHWAQADYRDVLFVMRYG